MIQVNWENKRERERMMFLSVPKKLDILTDNVISFVYPVLYLTVQDNLIGQILIFLCSQLVLNCFV